MRPDRYCFRVKRKVIEWDKLNHFKAVHSYKVIVLSDSYWLPLSVGLVIILIIKRLGGYVNCGAWLMNNVLFELKRMK
jgi:hypothetical protein